MIRRLLVAAAAPVVAAVTRGPLLDRLARRILAAPRRAPGEAELAPALDRLGGEVVRLRSRDGLRLTGRWLPAAAEAEAGGWTADAREAILLLHGYSGSIVPDLVEFAPLLRGTANVLGIDFRGHGGSEDAPTTFGMHEVEDVAGALVWLGERGITRVALFGTSMGGMTALAAVAVLGDGRLVNADLDPDAPASPGPPPRPAIVGVVADSVAPELAVVVASRMRVPLGRTVANLAFARIARMLGADPRATEPIRVIGLLEDLPLLLVHGGADPTVPLADARRLVAAAPPGTRHVVVPAVGHARGHPTDPEKYAGAVVPFLRDAFVSSRAAPGATDDKPAPADSDDAPILAAETPPAAGDVHRHAARGASG